MTIKPVRIQRSRRKGSKLTSPNGLPVVCVTRPGRWGNPYQVGKTMYVPGAGQVKVCDKEQAVRLYRKNVMDLVFGVMFRETVRRELRGKNLACWCRPGELCHGDVLLEIANSKNEK